MSRPDFDNYKHFEEPVMKHIKAIRMASCHSPLCRKDRELVKESRIFCKNCGYALYWQILTPKQFERINK